MNNILNSKFARTFEMKDFAEVFASVSNCLSKVRYVNSASYECNNKLTVKVLNNKRSDYVYKWPVTGKAILYPE